MTKKQKILFAKCTAILCVIPALIYAYAGGPDPGYSGVPGERGNCTSCHAGTVNSGDGSVSVTFPNGLAYTPGVVQQLKVTVADPVQRRWGFQLTARTETSTSTQAGTFTPGQDGFTHVLCATPSLRCSSGTDLQYIEHTSQGTRTGTTDSATFEFDWNPPATDVGNIVIYVAGNAANGTGTDIGDHIYTKTYTLAPGAAGGQKPIITRVQNGAGFQSTIAPGSWLDIRGTNLASVTATWDNAVINGKLPTKLPGSNTTVTINGKAAYIYYLSPTQINVLASPDVGTGSGQVVVTTDGVSSDAGSATVDQFSPALFLWPGSYAVATRQDATKPFVVKAGEFADVTTIPAKPAEIVTLWGTGFGTTDPAAPKDTVVPLTPLHNITAVPTITIGGLAASYLGGALAPNFAGLYQLNIKVPDLPDGDWPVEIQIGGVSSPAGVMLTVKK